MLFYRKCAVLKDNDLERSQLNSYGRAVFGLKRVILTLPRIGKEFGMNIALKVVGIFEPIAPSDNGRARDKERRFTK
jgi:hypothetical protein